MIQEIKGNLLEVERGIIVHGCNAQGVMGSGVAKQIKEKYPQAYDVYKAFYDTKSLLLGNAVIVYVKKSLWVANGITQKYYGYNPAIKYINYDAVEGVFEQVREFNEPYNLPICFPKIGAGLGGGNWKIISTIIDETIPDTMEKRLYSYGE